MNGLSDVRLVLKPEELRQVAIAEQLCAPAPATASAANRWHSFWRRLATRQALLRLNDEQLEDIGLSREQARREALLPLWKL